MRRIFKRLSVAVVGLLTLLVMLAAGGAAYQAIATNRDERRYPPPGQMVDVGTHSLHLHCVGEGSPTVVLDAGGGGWSSHWHLVQSELASVTRTCAYDRSGYGWSEASGQGATSQHYVEDLHALLHAAGIPDPYVLVGHSLGGLNAQLYAHHYPDEVAGMVLVDSGHPRLPLELPDELQDAIADQQQMLGTIRVLAHIGVLRIIATLGLLPGLDDLDNLPSDVRSSVIAHNTSPQFFNTLAEESSSLDESAEQVRRAGPSLGDKPLVVITHGIPYEDDYNGVPLPSNISGQMVEDIWQGLQADLTTLSTQSSLLVAEQSGHNIPLEQPEIVVQAIQEVMRHVQSKPN